MTTHNTLESVNTVHDLNLELVTTLKELNLNIRNLPEVNEDPVDAAIKLIAEIIYAIMIMQILKDELLKIKSTLIGPSPTQLRLN